MSAYAAGPVEERRRGPILSPLVLAFPQPSAFASSLAIFHVTLEDTPTELVNVLHTEFSAELDRGNTYPQEGPMSLNAFKAYFFAADVFVGIALPDAANVTQSIEAARNERSWQSCVLGFYYIKPNYPGRSSHICNAGFVVPNESRGLGVGRLLAQSYLHFAPTLGYKGSIFNLVYASNTASMALWDKLGFTRIGVIPRAGRLRQSDGTEAYVDAFVIWKSFEGIV